MAWVGPNGRVYSSKRWAVVTAIGAAAATFLTWLGIRSKELKCTLFRPDTGISRRA